MKVRVKGPEPTILHSMKIEKTSPWPICMPARAARRSSEGVHLVRVRVGLGLGVGVRVRVKARVRVNVRVGPRVRLRVGIGVELELGLE